MTNPNPTAAPSAPSAPSALDPHDPRAVFARAVGLARQVVSEVGPHQLDDPTPCSEYTVRELLGHLLGVLGRVAACGTGADPLAVNTEPPFAPVADWPRAFLDGAHTVLAAWSDDATLDRIVVLPWAQLPGGAMLAMYTNELTVHTWDLARAVGAHPDWNDEVLAVSLSAIERALPADGRIAGVVPFAPVVAVPADAALIDRLVAWNGRQP